MPQFDTQFFSSLLFWEWVSFGILLLILYKYAFPWILENLDARERKFARLSRRRSGSGRKPNGGWPSTMPG